MTNILVSQTPICSLALAFLDAEPEPGIQMHVVPWRKGSWEDRNQGILRGQGMLLSKDMA